ncbi:MAG: hypothetical protein E3J72_12450 [Planctomycetota bacterium]|nr:MAG: hypothetical protein E3J72_12450 [Planctomycetota bacterium]
MTNTPNTQLCDNPRITTPTSRGRREGVTLLEIVIAAMVLVVGLLSFFAVFLNCTKLDQTSKESITAMNFARKTMENLRATDFDSIGGKAGPIPANEAPVELDVITGVPVGNVTVVTRPDGLLDVTVIVRWAGITGDRRLELEALFAPTE